MSDLYNSYKVLKNNEGQAVQTIPSYEVAEMMGRAHKEVLKMLEGQKSSDGSTKHVGIIQVISESGELHLSDYFIESSYKVPGNNRTYKCYECTKMGCDILANKMTGEKGTIFTARYVKNFTEIAKELNKSSSSVRSMASHMGIKKPHRQWESEKVANLIKHYSDPNITISQICQLLGETKGAVDYQVRKLGLKKATNLGWTADQEELLRQLYCEENETIELIAQKLGKNTPAVNSKIARMKLKRNKRK